MTPQEMTTLTLRVAELKAENERLKRALYNIQFTATKVFEPEEPPVSQAGSEA